MNLKVYLALWALAWWWLMLSVACRLLSGGLR